MTMKIKWNIKGFKELRTSLPVQKTLDKAGDDIAGSASGNYVVKTEAGKNRARTAVITADIETIRSNSKSSDLLRALSSRGR